MIHIFGRKTSFVPYNHNLHHIGSTIINNIRHKKFGMHKPYVCQDRYLPKIMSHVWSSLSLLEICLTFCLPLELKHYRSFLPKLKELNKWIGPKFFLIDQNEPTFISVPWKRVGYIIKKQFYVGFKFPS